MSITSGRLSTWAGVAVSFLLGFAPPPLLSRGKEESVEKKGGSKEEEEGRRASRLFVYSGSYRLYICVRGDLLPGAYYDSYPTCVPWSHRTARSARENEDSGRENK